MSGAATIAAVAAVAGVGVSAYSTIKQQQANSRAREQQEESLRQQQEAITAQQAQAEQQMALQQEASTKQLSIAEQSLRQTDSQLKTAEQSANKFNAKRPDSTAMLSQTEQAAKAGASGTMLTGPQGVDPTSLSLSKNTLLGS